MNERCVADDCILLTGFGVGIVAVLFDKISVNKKTKSLFDFK